MKAILLVSPRILARRAGAALVAMLVAASFLSTFGQSAGDPRQERDRALQLLDANKFAEAIPILEKIVQDNPKDTVAIESLAYALAASANPLADAEARLFIGDCYFKLKQTDKAGEWFSKAILIKPDTGTAYRYWGDALTAAGKTAEAREKFIDAVLAEPYLRQSWAGLAQWARAARVTLGHPVINVPKQSISRDASGKIVLGLNVDPSKKEPDPWLIYSLERAMWFGGGEMFKKAFPNEKEYRHSLQEEAKALSIVARTARDYVKQGKVKEPDASLTNLMKLEERGLIEAYVLLALADQGISQDYPAYRAAHRDKLREYLDTFVVPRVK